MRLFQNAGLYPSYRVYFDHFCGKPQNFNTRLNAFLADRFGATHFLLPVLEGDRDAFFTNGDDEILQRAWAKENGLPEKSSLENILLAQIEAHKTEVFYNLDPMRFGSVFVRRLPSCVRHTLAWRAAPSPNADFSAFGRILNNFPSILNDYEQRGWSTAYFSPAHDPVMNTYAQRKDRPIDVLFVGGYSRHHQQRTKILKAVASLSSRYAVRYHLDRSRLTRLSESPLGLLPFLNKQRRPFIIRKISAAPVFGLELYEALSQAKIVLNGAIDMAGQDRGNMRCFEAMGCGALLVSDQGVYPKDIQSGSNMLTYTNENDVACVIESALADWGRSQIIAANGLSLMKNSYNKLQQWMGFKRIVENM